MATKTILRDEYQQWWALIVVSVESWVLDRPEVEISGSNCRDLYFFPVPPFLLQGTQEDVFPSPNTHGMHWSRYLGLLASEFSLNVVIQRPCSQFSWLISCLNQWLHAGKAGLTKSGTNIISAYASVGFNESSSLPCPHDRGEMNSVG